MSGNILELDDVSAAYSTYRALFGVTLAVPDNGIIALVGSNGAGKSTLARVASGLVPISGGSIRVEGQNVSRWPAHRIAALGVVHVPEGRAIFSTLSVEENLRVSFSRRIGRKETPAALGRAYEAFPVLAERRRQLGGTLSGGQQRILSLAKVLAVPPKLLIVDELSLGLAPVIVDQVYDGLVAIHRQGCALLVVEQQVDRVLAIADRAVLLVKGAVAWEGPARDARATLEAQMLGGTSANGTVPRPPPTGRPRPRDPLPPSERATTPRRHRASPRRLPHRRRARRRVRLRRRAARPRPHPHRKPRRRRAAIRPTCGWSTRIPPTRTERDRTRARANADGTARRQSGRRHRGGGRDRSRDRLVPGRGRGACRRQRPGHDARRRRHGAGPGGRDLSDDRGRRWQGRPQRRVGGRLRRRRPHHRPGGGDVRVDRHPGEQRRHRARPHTR